MQSKNEVMKLIKALDEGAEFISDLDMHTKRRQGFVNRFIRAPWVPDAAVAKEPKAKAILVAYKPTPVGTQPSNATKGGAKTAQKKH